MNDNWEKLLQLSLAREGHKASSTGLLEETDPNRSILDLGSRSPPLGSSLEITGTADVTGSIGSSVGKIRVYHDNKESIWKGIKKASDRSNRSC